jgi:hypothetical protein
VSLLVLAIVFLLWVQNPLRELHIGGYILVNATWASPHTPRSDVDRKQH